MNDWIKAHLFEPDNVAFFEKTNLIRTVQNDNSNHNTHDNPVFFFARRARETTLLDEAYLN